MHQHEFTINVIARNSYTSAECACGAFRTEWSNGTTEITEKGA